MQTQLDRRERRTDDVDIAAQYQLDHIIQDFGVRAVVLVDDSGDVVARSGPSDETRRLAQHAFSLARQGRESSDYGCSFRVDGRSFVVAAAGPEKEYREVGVFRAILGIRRILRG